MSEFMTSNGFTITNHSGGEGIMSFSGGAKTLIDWPEVQALREYFQAERDTTNGVWRWPENPEYVVKAWGDEPDAVYVLHEKTLNIVKTYRQVVKDADQFFHQTRQAARAYFDAHPEHKPWHEALPQQVWLLTEGGREFPAIVTIGEEGGDYKFTTSNYRVIRLDDPVIQHAERIWPKEDGEPA